MIFDSFDPRTWGPVKNSHQIVSIQRALETSELHLHLEVQKPCSQCSDAMRRRYPLAFPTGCDIGRSEVQEIVPVIAGVKS